MEKIDSILIINLGGLGDLILSVPAVRAIRKLYPTATISILTSRYGYEVARNLPYVNGAFTLGLKTLLRLRKKRFSLAVNMRTIESNQGAVKLKILLSIIGARLTAGRNTDGRGAFFDIKIQETRIGKKYESEYDIELAETLGAKDIDKRIDFDIDRNAVAKMAQILKHKGISKNDSIIGIHPGGEDSRRWPLENFSEVIRGLGKELPCKFVITGSLDDVELANKLKYISGPNVISLAGETSLQETAALIRECALFISNDTGPMHIAAALKTPLVAILGPGDLVRFDPRHLSDRTEILYKKVDCAPCNAFKCRSMKCIKWISPDDVIRASLKLLKR